MQVLLTGASGFLGDILNQYLAQYFSIISLGRHPQNLIQCDISKSIPQIDKPIQAVIHAAGKAHIYPKTDEEKKAFYDVNVTGTNNLLEALTHQQISHFIFISSVSVYGIEQGELVNEETPLRGNSPYAKSKIEAEQLIESWCKTRNINYLILRLPLVVGPNALGNLGKMVSAIRQGKYLRIAKGEAKKSAVLASDIAKLIQQWLTQNNPTSGIYNITDGYHPNFYELEIAIQKALNARFIPSIPSWLGKCLGIIGDKFSWMPVNSGTIKKITGTFTFSDEKARREIAWQSQSVLEAMI